MAKKTIDQQPSMIDTFREFKETKNIDRATLVSVLEESFRNVIAKIFGSDSNFNVIVNQIRVTSKFIVTVWLYQMAR